jgi:hypothetical protein
MASVYIGLLAVMCCGLERSNQGDLNFLRTPVLFHGLVNYHQQTEGENLQTGNKL